MNAQSVWDGTNPGALCSYIELLVSFIGKARPGGRPRGQSVHTPSALGAGFPRIEVGFLFGSKGVDAYSHSLELEGSDFFVD